MKFLEISNIRISLSNEEKTLYSKIKNEEIPIDDLNEREKILVYNLLSKNIVFYKEKEGKTYICSIEKKEKGGKNEYRFF